LLGVFAQLRAVRPDCLLLLAPRHPERCDEVAQLCRRRGLRTCRRSQGVPAGPGDDVLLLDTVGELALLYAAATVAFVGGSLVPSGGHNLLEAAALGVPVVSGPHLHNLGEAAERLRAAGALAVVADHAALAALLPQLFSDGQRLAEMARAGREVAAAQRGATARVLRLVTAALPPGG